MQWNIEEMRQEVVFKKGKKPGATKPERGIAHFFRQIEDLEQSHNEEQIFRGQIVVLYKRSLICLAIE
jgi:hypothetical protein